MIENDAQELERPGASDAVLWFFDNVAYGHLDDIPDDVLFALFEDYNLCGQASHIAFTGHICNSDDPIVLHKAINETSVFTKQPFVIFRAWITLECGRRTELFKEEMPDMLLKELCIEEDFPLKRGRQANFWVQLRDNLMQVRGIKEIKK